MTQQYDSSQVNLATLSDASFSYNPRGRQPDSVNAFLNTNFKFTLTRLPNVTFWCSSVNIPQISIGEVTVQNRFVPHHVPGSSIQMDPLRVTFSVDEEFSNWNEIYRWMRSIVPFEDFSEILRNENQYYSDGIIHCLNSAKNPNKKFVFKNMFPTNLDGFDLNVALNEPDPVSVTATFTYESFEIEDVT
jgi:hypothetical protein